MCNPGIRLTHRPGDFSLFLRGLLPRTNFDLVPSEQLGFGHYDTACGYDQHEVNANEGYITNVELRPRRSKLARRSI